MTFGELMTTLRDTLSARRVYAEPVRQEGVVVIPAAVVFGGGGGGAGPIQSGPQEGGGLGLLARPVGAFVITDGAVRWVPAVDVSRIVTVAAAAAVVGLLITRGGRS